MAARAGLLALDTLGSCLASCREDFGRAVLDAAERLGGAPEATLVGRKSRVGAASAVLANGTLAHGLDFDDTREDAIVHTGCVAVPTALAVGEAVGASGRATLEAMIAGVEVMCRVGLAVPGRFHARHYHPTGLTGSFAAAAVAGRLHRLTEDQQVHAFGICGSQAAGIIEYLADGSWTKRLHPGWAAHAGVAAVALARAGFTGPETVFEGEHGFYAAFAGGHDATRIENLLATLGRTWELSALTFKPYPCGSIAHPYMDCALRLRERHRLRPERDRGGALPHRGGAAAAALGAAHGQAAPRNGYAAKFSLPYLLASILVNGRATLADFTDEAARDETRAGGRRAGLLRHGSDHRLPAPLHRPRGDPPDRRHPARGAAGSPARRARLPDDREELIAKFRANARPRHPGGARRARGGAGRRPRRRAAPRRPDGRADRVTEPRSPDDSSPPR